MAFGLLRFHDVTVFFNVSGGEKAPVWEPSFVLSLFPFLGHNLDDGMHAGLLGLSSSRGLRNDVTSKVIADCFLVLYVSSHVFEEMEPLQAYDFFLNLCHKLNLVCLTWWAGRKDVCCSHKLSCSNEKLDLSLGELVFRFGRH